MKCLRWKDSELKKILMFSTRKVWLPKLHQLSNIVALGLVILFDSATNLSSNWRISRAANTRNAEFQEPENLD